MDRVQVMSVSVDESVLKMARDAAYEGRVSLSSWVGDAIAAKVDAHNFLKSEAVRMKGVSDEMIRRFPIA